MIEPLALAAGLALAYLIFAAGYRVGYGRGHLAAVLKCEGLQIDLLPPAEAEPCRCEAKAR